MEKSVYGVCRVINILMVIFACLSYSFVPLDCTTTTRTNIHYVSALGDPGMRNDSLRVAIEAWNQCNEVGEEAMNMGSPRMADCFDLDYSSLPAKIIHKVDEEDNKLGVRNGTYGGINAGDNADIYAAQKEIYLGNKCQVMDNPNPWQFWMIMLKNGNTDTLAAICPENGKKAKPFPQTGRFPCFGKGCMNMPSMHHEYTRFDDQEEHMMSGSFYGTWDLDSDDKGDSGVVGNNSYYKVRWEKKIGGNESWVFHHLLKTSSKYPWLMLYLRADASRGLSGGYHYDSRGMMKMTLKSPNFKVTFKLEVLKGGGSGSQFYLMDMGSCWKNDGRDCDGDVTTDVTRYSEMIINPEATAVCNRNRLSACPPQHTFPNGTIIHRTEKEKFPYEAYHYYCVPGNARFAESPYEVCDPYSNPQPQEILQILPHSVWEEFGYPTKKGQGWIGHSRSWELDVGKLSQSLYFYQDPKTKPVERHWSSIDLGTEIYMSKNQIAEWTVTDFNIVIPKTDISM
uniref:DUF7705 domain-containing protein n=1 Tax=Noccaea caerulescens TaxID=107243 RepID=A0A1J3H0X8_NOCCA